MAPLGAPDWLQRIAALLLVALGVPLVLSISAYLQDAPIRVGEPSPRTIISPDLIRVVDHQATERERRTAADAVSPVLVGDDEARSAFVQDVRDAFARVKGVREPGDQGLPPTYTEQIEALESRLPMLDEEALQALVRLSDSQLQEVAAGADAIARQIALRPIRESNLDTVVEEQLNLELAVSSFPDGIGQQVVAPLIRSAARPTVRVDEAETQAARDEAAAEVAEIVRPFLADSVIVSAGQVVDELQMEALRARGLEGAEPFRATARALVLVLALTAAISFYLRAYRQQIWRSSRRLLLLACLFVSFAALVEAVVTLVPLQSAGWWYVAPVGAIAMLATILFDPPVGVLVAIPITTVVAFAAGGDPGVVAFSAIASLASVPLVSRLSARGDLRRAAWESTLIYIALAGALAVVFEAPLLNALIAGVLNGVLTAVIVNGSLPFLESVFGILTSTSLLDLADRNHPLLLELQQKALGSYNHSVMVANMVESAARRIEADSLLASVQALYHDIGKVRRPYFFVENQFGISNPHDDLPPEQSADIIQRHVTDGLEMARTSRLPAEVVDGIASHHGTTLVTYFYRQAVNDAPDGVEVDENHYRYKGRKPASKETAILMLADCCEGASRAAALNNRNLSQEDLEEIVDGLFAERIEDGQLDEANLTFRELSAVRTSFIETLVGVYHPRIAYPKLRKKAAALPDGASENGSGHPAEGTPVAGLAEGDEQTRA